MQHPEPSSVSMLSWSGAISAAPSSAESPARQMGRVTVFVSLPSPSQGQVTLRLLCTWSWFTLWLGTDRPVCCSSLCKADSGFMERYRFLKKNSPAF